MIPYTYLVGWSKLNKWYYGSRFANGCHPTDFWKKYFTSSNYVKKFRKEHGEPDIIEIRRTFKTKKEASDWEFRVLSAMHKLTPFGPTSKWINRAVGHHVINEPGKFLGEKNGMFGKTHTKKVKQKLAKLASQRFKGKTYDQLYSKEKASELRESRRTSPSALRSKKGELNPMFGKQQTKETRLKISKAKALNNPLRGSRWTTNGIENKKIMANELIPKGYRLGRTF